VQIQDNNYRAVAIKTIADVAYRVVLFIKVRKSISEPFTG
jgi:hypothetical protein